MSETPGRRATRSSVRGPSATPAPSVARRPRAKTPKAPAPLPAVATGTSHAYGASGKVTLYTQVDSRSEGSFAARFIAGRGAAVSRDEDVVVSSVSSGVSSAIPQLSAAPSAPSAETPYGRRRTPVSISSRRPADSFTEDNTTIEDVDGADGAAADDDDDDHGEDSGPTNVPSDFSYGDGPSGGLVPPATQAEVDAARPWSLAVLWETTLRWIRMMTAPWTQLHPFLKTLLLASTLAAILLFALADLALLRDQAWNIYHQASDITRSSVDFVPSWKTGSGSSAASDSNLAQRVTSIENDLMRLRRETELAHAEITLIKEYVPENVMIQKNKATGEWELPLNFWNALREKLSEQGSSIAWETFIRTNQAKLDAAAKRAMEKASPDRRIINQDMVIEQIQKSRAEIEDGLQNVAARHANAAAKRAVNNLVHASPAAERSIKELHKMASTHVARNTELALRSRNYFSPGLGAKVDPHLTSPTHQTRQKNWKARLYGLVSSFAPNTHAQALTDWAEAADCWCAAKSDDKGKAQLAVIMPRHVVPTSITIEHIPAQGTLSIGAAPREFEVWVRNVETTNTPTPSSEYGLDGACGASPAAGFVCIGKGQYDIHAPSHIQNFALEAGEAVGLVNKAIIKFNNNWGMPYTCLYRIRFHGDFEPEIYVMEEA